MTALPLDLQILNALAAVLLLVSFAMLSQRRIVTLVNLLAIQGTGLLCAAPLLLAWRTGENHMYLSALLTLALKVVFLPWLLHRLIRRLGVYWDTEPVLNIPGTMLVALLISGFVIKRSLYKLRIWDQFSRILSRNATA